MEQYGLPVIGAVLFAPSIALPLVADYMWWKGLCSGTYHQEW